MNWTLVLSVSSLFAKRATLPADKSRDETSQVDEVVRMWKTTIDSYGMPCILVFGKYYFSTVSIEVLTEREKGADKPSTLFIGSARASTMKTVMADFDGKVKKPGEWERLYNEEKKLLMVRYYDFDRYMSNAFVRFVKISMVRVMENKEYK